MVAFKLLFSMSCMTQTVECYFSIEFSLEETHVEGPIRTYAVEWICAFIWNNCPITHMITPPCIHTILHSTQIYHTHTSLRRFVTNAFPSSSTPTTMVHCLTRHVDQYETVCVFSLWYPSFLSFLSLEERDFGENLVITKKKNDLFSLDFFKFLWEPCLLWRMLRWYVQMNKQETQTLYELVTMLPREH